VKYVIIRRQACIRKWTHPVWVIRALAYVISATTEWAICLDLFLKKASLLCFTFFRSFAISLYSRVFVSDPNTYLISGPLSTMHREALLPLSGPTARPESPCTTLQLTMSSSLRHSFPLWRRISISSHPTNHLPTTKGTRPWTTYLKDC
jgi:hypothetical protein